MALSRGKKISILVLLVLLADQISKIWIKTHMTLGQSFSVIGEWFRIYFIENNGMAFGMQFGGLAGKLFLTLFRLVLAGFIIYYLNKLIKKKRDSVGRYSRSLYDSCRSSREYF